MKKQVRAFTLVELLVAMALGGIIISAGYVSYRMAGRNYISFRNRSGEMNQAVALKGVLLHDIRIAQTVKKYSASEISLVQNDTVTVNYEWNEKYVLRKNPVEKDTFFLPVKKAEMRFNGLVQDKTGGLLDELIFTVYAEGHEFMFYFDAQYPSDILMKNENSADGRN